MKKHTIAVSLTQALLLSALSYSAWAAQVPPGTKLAEKQVIVINNGTEPVSLDPHKVEGVPESNIILNLLEGLVSTDGDGHIVPGVAESWSSPDNRIWTFTLRPDAKWSDGSPVTAQDFVYSWRRLTDPKTASPYGSYLHYAYVENVDDIISGKKTPESLGVKAVDDKTFQVQLTQPVPYFPDMLSHTALKPVPKGAIEQFGDKWTSAGKFVGNGAYTLSAWNVNERLVLKRNPKYWNDKDTVIEQVTFLPLQSETSDINRYRAGEIDVTNSSVPPVLFAKMKKDIPAQVQISPYLCTFYYEINNTAAPFTDPKVREAVKLGLDRDIITHKIMGQGQIPAYGFTPHYINGGHFTTPEWASLTQEQRNEKGRKLLEEAGYSEKNPLTFELLYNTSDQNKQQAIAAASMWQKNIGAKVVLKNQEWKTSNQNRHEGNYQVARATWCADYNEPSSFLNIFLSDSSNNTSFYRNIAFDSAMQRALLATDEKTRQSAYQEAETQLDQDSALIPVYYRVSVRLIKPSVGGITGNDPLDYMDIKRLYMVETH